MTRLCLLIGVVLPMCVPLSASTVGTFNMSGTITATVDTITWTSDLGPGFAPDMFTLTAGTGIYAGEDGQNGIADLNSSTEPTGTMFAAVPFITFDVAPSAPLNLSINFIAKGLDSSADCGAAPAPGQTCTPILPPGDGFSPFNFQNLSGGGSTASFTFSGIDGMGDTWTGQFTSQFSVPFQTVLAELSTAPFSVSNSYSATEITVNSPSVPEPGSSVMMIGGGLLLLSLSVKKFARKQT